MLVSTFAIVIPPFSLRFQTKKWHQQPLIRNDSNATLTLYFTAPLPQYSGLSSYYSPDNFIITLFVKNEYSYDKFNKNFDRIYRMESGNWCVIPPGLGHILNGQIPEIEKLTRILYVRNQLLSPQSPNTNSQFQSITSAHNLAVDSTFFDIFDLEFISGSPENALREPLTMVLTESIAKKLFGEEDALNKVVTVGNSFNFKIDGVIKDPKNFHLMTDMLLSITSMDKFQGEGTTTTLTSSNYLTYFLFSKEHDVDIIRTKIFNFFKDYEATRLLDEDDTEEFIILRPLEEIYFFKDGNTGMRYQS